MRLAGKTHLFGGCWLDETPPRMPLVECLESTRGGIRMSWRGDGMVSEVLWNAFAEDTIPISTYFGAWSAQNETLLKLKVHRIFSVVIGRVRGQREKVINRTYCGGLFIPKDIRGHMSGGRGIERKKQIREGL